MDEKDNQADDPIDAAERKMEQAAEEDDPVRLEAISQLHDILELELERPEEEGEQAPSEEESEPEREGDGSEES